MVANADASYINPSVPPPEYMYEPVVVVIGVPANVAHITRIVNAIATREGSWFNVEAVVVVRRH